MEAGGVSRSMSGETPDLHKRLLKSTTLETLRIGDKVSSKVGLLFLLLDFICLLSELC